MRLLALLLWSCSSSPASDPGKTDASAVDSGPAGETGGGDTGPTLDPVIPDHPNFIVIYGEARGWTSTSVQQDETVADSKSAIFLTPNLDDLAADGVVFADFAAPSPRCMPSRAALLTGKSPAQLHMTFVGEGASDGVPTGDVVPPDPLTTLPTSEMTVASLLHDAGYATAHFGKWHAGNIDPSAYGFDESDGPTTNKGPDGGDHPNPTEAYGTVERGIDFMTRAVAAGAPFYLQVSHYGGNDVIDALPETYAAEAARLAGADADDIIDAAIIQDMDITIGQLLAAVDALGLTDTTYILFTADHGAAGRHANAPLAQGKGTIYEGGVRVPLLLRGPGVQTGLRTHVQASQVDLLPTLAHLAGLEEALPAGVEGGDLWAVVSAAGDTVSRPREEFVVHFPHYDKDAAGPASSIRMGTTKLIHRYEDDRYELYDLSTDLGEENDLSTLEPATVATLAGHLEAYLSAVGAQMPGHL